MKVKYALVVFLVAVLALVLVAGPALGKAGSITGGGRFINQVLPLGNNITFGFTAQPTSEGPVATAKGQFQLIDRGSETTRMHGTIDSINLTGPLRFSGILIGGDEVPFTVDITDADDGEPGFDPGDIIMITIGTDWTPTYAGVLQGGNIKHH